MKIFQITAHQFKNMKKYFLIFVTQIVLTAALTAPVTAGQNTNQPIASASHGVARLLGQEIAAAVKKVMPAVVVVRTEAVLYLVAQDRFRGFLYEIPRRLAGQGSGVIFRPDGHILTCHHVVDGAQQIEIALHDGTLYQARLVGSDPESDLAVLKIETPPPGLTIVEPADSDAVQIGEFAIAIGSPFSLASSVTLGIVSQKGRSVGLLPYEDFIQTDASINPGNSGGPLVDVDGRLIGINDAITTGGQSQGNVGIGFAVPSNLAFMIADSIIKNGFFRRPRIGITMDMLSSEEARERIGRDNAAVVDKVFLRSPADAAGLRSGDIILQINDEIVNSISEVQRAILQHPDDMPIKLRIKRDAKELELSIKDRI